MNPGDPIRVVRIVSRLNVGGPAIQAISLTKLLQPLGYDTTLVRGTEGKREGSMDYLADRLGVQPHRVAALRRDLGAHDLQALVRIAGVLRRVRPQILHTHAAKAGTLGRLATTLPGVPRPKVLVHTFHGHVLTGYFSHRRAELFRRIERALAVRTSCLVAVSDEVKEDLLRLGIADESKIEVVPLGFDLGRFAHRGAQPQLRAETRVRLGIPSDARLVTLVARLVPIKRVDRFLRVAYLLSEHHNVRFLIAGDGELWDQLHTLSVAGALANRVHWAGFQEDMPSIMCASDVVVLTSDNEGTPVSLIEAHASGRPVVSTRAGGVGSVVLEGESGWLVEADDDQGFASAVADLLDNPERAQQFGRVGQSHVLARYGTDRLVRDVDDLYRRLLGRS